MMDNKVYNTKPVFPFFCIKRIKFPAPSKKISAPWGGDFLDGAVNFLLSIRKIPEKQVLCLQVIHNLSSSITIIANFSKLQFESLLKDVSKYILRLLYHHYIVKVFILEKKSGLSISLNLVKQSFQCFHPEPNPKISIPFNC